MLLTIPLVVAVIVFFAVLFYINENSAKGALNVTSEPKSEVYLNSKLVGDTPLCLCEPPQMLAIGEYSVKLIPKDTGFKPFEEKITINKSTLTSVERIFSKEEDRSEGTVVTLSSLPNKRDIEILAESVPLGANVFLNNSPIGKTPLLLKKVSEGDHDLRIIQEGFKDKLIKINTALGYRLTSRVFLGISDLANNLATPSGEVASSSAKVTPTILILDTPTGFLRVRESTSTASLEIGRVLPGETYELSDEKSGWFEIQFDDEKKGWISSQYAEKQ